MAVDAWTDPHNLGATCAVPKRSCHGSGAAPSGANAGLTGSVAKVAAGALEHSAVAKVDQPQTPRLNSSRREGYACSVGPG